MTDYISLSRNFRPINTDESDYQSARELARTFGKPANQGWENVLAARRAVVLAEAGNGKTEELKQQARKLKDEGRFAVFVPVEDLDNARLEDALDATEASLFEAWKATDGTGYFFIDSVDEARLTQKSFRRCVLNLQKAIHGNAERATIVISCRWSDWDAKGDLYLLNDKLLLVTLPPQHDFSQEEALISLLEVRKGDKEASTVSTVAEQPFQIFILEELDETQRTAFIRAKDVTNTAAFTHELERNGLSPLAGRPKDLLDFVDYWHSHKEQLGSRTAMLRFVTDTRLLEERKNHPGNQDLSIEKLRLGAARIAAAMILGKTFYVRVGRPIDAQSSPCVDPMALLPDWSEDQINALLRRGIFTPASLGRAKFHHREAMEYLAAVWFKHLIDSGCPRSVVHSQIVVETYGQETIVPSLRATAAWLAVLDDTFQNDIIAREPLILIQHGDPGSLPIPARCELLVKYAALHAEHKISNDHLDNSRLWMFAHPGLEATILKVWPDHYEYDLRGDLIRLIMTGKLTGCLPAVRNLLDDPCANRHQGLWALECLIELHDTSALQAFAARYMASYRDMPIGFQARIAELLYPEYLTLDQLFEVIEHSRKPDRGSVEGFGSCLKHLWLQCPETDQLRFADKLATLALRPPFLHDYNRVSSQYVFLARRIGPVCRGLLQRPDSATAPDEIIRCLMAFGRCDKQDEGFRRDERPIHQILAAKPTVKRAVLWAEARDARACAEPGQSITAIWHLNAIFPLLSDSDVNDAEWLLQDARDPSRHLDDRKIALSAVWRLLRSPHPPNSTEIEAAIATHPELKAYWQDLQKPSPDSPAMKRLEERQKEYEQKEQRTALKARASWLEFQRNIVASPNLLRTSGERFHYLHHISELLKRNGTASDEHFLDHINLIGSVLSPAVQSAYESALKDHWRVLDTKEEEVHTWNQIYARAGVCLEFRKDLSAFDVLPEDLARKAITFGVWDHHRDWLQRLIDRRPDIGLPLVAEAIVKGLQHKVRHSSFLYYYARQAAEVPGEITRRLLTELDTQTLDDAEVTGYVILLLVKSRLSASDRDRIVGKFRQALAQAVASNAFNRQAQCIAGIMAADLKEGVDTLLSILENSEGEHKTSFCVAAFGTLFDNHHTGIAVGLLPRMEVGQLVSLYRLARSHIPRPERINGVRGVDAVDHAQHGQGAVLSALEHHSGRDAYTGMRDLADLDDSRNGWYLQKAKSMLERDSEPQAWCESEVLAFETRFTAPIKNGRQLHMAATHALERFRDDMKRGDASLAGLLKAFSGNKIRDEGALRDAVMSKLIDSDTSVFHSAKENQVGQNKRPDIFLASTTCPFQVAIEVKQADQWTGNELVAALEMQLIGQYLYPQNRRNGILLLINTGAKKHWKLPGQQRMLGFLALIKELERRASALSHVNGRETISVFGLDVST